jgi:hypothetical protein
MTGVIVADEFAIDGLFSSLQLMFAEGVFRSLFDFRVVGWSFFFW